MTEDKPAATPVDLTPEEIKAREQMVADDLAKRAQAPAQPEPKPERSARIPPSTP